MSSNVVLIGMPGSGKSTVGTALAKLLDMDFQDGDDVIRAVTGKPLSDIMDERGPMGFLQLENEILAGVPLENMVFSPGGSSVYEDEAMRHLGENAVIVYLETSQEEIAARVGDLHERGVVLKNGIGMSLEELFDEREPLYRQYADLIVNEEGIGVEEAAEKVACALQEYGKKER